MIDSINSVANGDDVHIPHSVAAPVGAFQAFKRAFDVVVSLVLLPFLAISGLVLLALNPYMNRGPLIYRQERMGMNCLPFTAYKFRSMLPIEKVERGSADPLEHHRITRLGQRMRKSRIDELPQIINVLKGEMSLIGPRPDYLPHANEFVQTVRGYRTRHVIRPGISGLAQTEIGYAQGPLETQRKVRMDLFYIRNAGFRLEAWVIWRTLCIVFGQKGL
jgi:lipopolysaccharide/colanic/teichoic acid biosynthesis glycosyltransferase